MWEETPKGNRSVNDQVTRGWRGFRVRRMAHSTVDLVIPWFLGSTSAPSPSAPYAAGASQVESFLLSAEEMEGPLRDTRTSLSRMEVNG